FVFFFLFFFSSRRRHTRSYGDWSSDVCSSDLGAVDLHVRAAVLAHQDAIALLHLEGDALALLRQLAGAHGHDLALLGLLLRGIRSEERRVGKECRSRWSRKCLEKTRKTTVYLH